MSLLCSYAPCPPETRILLEAGPEPEEEAEHDCDQLTFFPMLTETPTATSTASSTSTIGGGDTPPETCNAEPCSHTHACAEMHAILQELDSGEEVLLGQMSNVANYCLHKMRLHLGEKGPYMFDPTCPSSRSSVKFTGDRGGGGRYLTNYGV